MSDSGEHSEVGASTGEGDSEDGQTINTGVGKGPELADGVSSDHPGASTPTASRTSLLSTPRSQIFIPSWNYAYQVGFIAGKESNWRFRAGFEAGKAVGRASSAWTLGLQRFVKPLRWLALGVGLTAAVAAVLVAAGIGYHGGLDWPKDGVIPDDPRPKWVVVLAFVAVSCFVWREWKWLKTTKAALWWFVVTLAYLGVCWLVLYPKAASYMGLVDTKAQARGLGVTTVVFFLIVAALILRAAAAADGAAPKTLTSIVSLSTSPGSTVILLWSLVVAYALGVIAGTVVLASNATQGTPPTFTCTADLTENCVDPGVWPGYLILLGLPGAAAVATAAQKRSAANSGSSGNAKDLPAVPDSAAGTTSAISDIQYFVFNIFAMSYVLATLIPYGRLPAIPDIVLALTGVSALVYAMNGQLNPMRKT